MIDSLAVLLLRLHLLSFYWGDVSLSNTLFRRDADAFSAYLVDAETGELHNTLTRGQRHYDVDLARTNIIGELMDLQAGGLLYEDVDVIRVGNRIEERYHELWEELTAEEVYSDDERWRISNKIKRLNELGFDVGELRMTTGVDGTHISLRQRLWMQVPPPDHATNRPGRSEQQARRMLNDLATPSGSEEQHDQPLELVAHKWLSEVSNPLFALSLPKWLRSWSRADLPRDFGPPLVPR